VNALAFSPTGNLLASGSGDVETKGAQIKLWDVTIGKELRTLIAAKAIVSLAFSPDGRVLASDSGDGSTKLWEVATGKELKTLGEAIGDYGSVSIAFSPVDGNVLARGDVNELALWDVQAGKPLRFLPGSYAFAFSPNGRALATSAGPGKPLTLIDAESGKVLQ